MPPIYDKRLLRQEFEEFATMKGRSWTPIVPVVAAILAKLNPPEVSDLGMGCGFLGRCLRKFGYDGYILGVDVHGPYLVQPWHIEYNLVQEFDIRRVTIADSVVALVEVLEHLEPPEADHLLSKIERGIISTPLDPVEQVVVNGNEHERHVHFYDQAYLARFGFWCISLYDVPQADHTTKRGALYVKGLDVPDVDPAELGPDWMIAGRPTLPGGEHRRLCLVMMVRDEAKVIERALDAAKPFIDDFVITDTGSSDGTPEVIRAWAERNSVPGKVIQGEWFDNWGKNRTEMFWNAQMNSSSFYGFILDADDLVERAHGLWTSEHDADAYRIGLKKGDSSWRRPDILRMQHVWWWNGADHPGIVSSTQITIGDLPWSVRAHSDGARTESQAKPWEKYLHGAALLENDMAKNPGNTRALFYFAQNMRDAGLAARDEREAAISRGDTAVAAECGEKAQEWFTTACAAYQQRIQLGGLEEERWFSMYQAGCLLEELGRDIEVPSTLLAAYEMRPWRCEPLVALAEHYRCRGWHHLALMVAEESVAIGYPKEDLLQVRDSFYEWQAEFELLHASLKTGAEIESFEEGVAMVEVWQKFPEEARAELVAIWTGTHATEAGA